MKKIKTIFLLLLMPLLLAACNEGENGGDGDTVAVEFLDLAADGSDTVATARLTLTFDKDITGLAAADITFDPGTTGASKGNLSKAGTGVYRLTVPGVSSRGDVSVTVSKAGYEIANGTKTVAVNFPRSHTVEFVANGGSPEPADQSVVYGTSVSRPQTPVKAGYLFSGWFTDEGLTERWNFSADKVTSDIVLYACFISQDQLAQYTAWDYFEAENITVGWNLGNSLDSVTAGTDERNWGNPYINQEIMDGVKAMGFNLIRIPVTWRGKMGAAPGYVIEEEYLQRVAEVVGYAENAGLTAIINVHHDSSWLSINTARGSTAGYDTVLDQYTKVWTQIAEYFKDFGLYLIFESFNEIHDGGWGHNNWSLEGKRQLEILDDWNQAFTDIVRGTGSMNAVRFLVISGYCQRPRNYGPDLLTLPEDTVEGKQIVSFHYYDPEIFALSGRTPNWGNADDLQRPVDDFTPFQTWYTSRRIPVIAGEIGPMKYRGASANPDMSEETVALAHENRIKYIERVYGVAAGLGIVPVYWDNGTYTSISGDLFGLFDRDTGLPYDDRARECLEAMVGATR
uniref:Glycoside hydrolase family 5 n=1 Tax=uncultured bacterium contig00026 TaxID=1181515 RepID=A0A806KAM5_9BACT|nr:glycoside hydrolase family 5 [uncultured bacterium contig00026]